MARDDEGASAGAAANTVDDAENTIDDKLEEQLLTCLTNDEVNVPAGVELTDEQLDAKIVILKNSQDQSMRLLKINYWTQIEELVALADGTANGFKFLMLCNDHASGNLIHHLQIIYSMRKLISEYEYIRRNNINYIV